MAGDEEYLNHLKFLNDFLFAYDNPETRQDIIQTQAFKGRPLQQIVGGLASFSPEFRDYFRRTNDFGEAINKCLNNQKERTRLRNTIRPRLEKDDLHRPRPVYEEENQPREKDAIDEMADKWKHSQEVKAKRDVAEHERSVELDKVYKELEEANKALDKAKQTEEEAALSGNEDRVTAAKVNTKLVEQEAIESAQKATVKTVN